jgi:hypothetical protein
VWIYSLILICLALMSPAFWLTNVPLLIFWCKPRTKAWYGWEPLTQAYPQAYAPQPGYYPSPAAYPQAGYGPVAQQQQPRVAPPPPQAPQSGT